MIYIEDKPISEVFRAVPWPFKIVIVLGSLFIVFSIVYVTVFMLGGLRNTDAAKTPGPLQILSNRSQSVLDPAIAGGPDGTKYMVYTSIQRAAETADVIGISLAETTKDCASWRFNKNILAAKTETLIAPDGQSELAFGVTRYETPTLVYVPEDKGREWKLYTYRYFWSENNVAFAKRYSVITQRTASNLMGEWSREEWLFSAAPDYPPPPYQKLVQNHVNRLHPSLARFTSYARPSALYKDGVLLMTLSAFADREIPEAVVLLASLDWGKSWRYLGTPLDASRLDAIGNFTRLGGVTLLQDGDGIYLAAVLGNDTVAAQGTFIFGFDEIETGRLLGNDKGAPRILQNIPQQSVAPTPIGGGFAAYHPDCAHGIVTSEFSGLRNEWQIFRTIKTPEWK